MLKAQTMDKWVWASSIFLTSAAFKGTIKHMTCSVHCCVFYFSTGGFIVMPGYRSRSRYTAPGNQNK